MFDFTPRNINCRLVCMLNWWTAEIVEVNRTVEIDFGSPFMIERYVPIEGWFYERYSGRVAKTDCIGSICTNTASQQKTVWYVRGFTEAVLSAEQTGWNYVFNKWSSIFCHATRPSYVLFLISICKVMKSLTIVSIVCFLV